MGIYDDNLERLYELCIDYVSYVKEKYEHGELTLEEFNALTYKKLGFIMSMNERVV